MTITGVNLTHLRALAKRLETQHELALQLWSTGDTLEALLDQIEKEMKQAPAQKQWAMNHCLAEMVRRHDEARGRVQRPKKSEPGGAGRTGTRLRVRVREREAAAKVDVSLD